MSWHDQQDRGYPRASHGSHSTSIFPPLRSVPTHVAVGPSWSAPRRSTLAVPTHAPPGLLDGFFGGPIARGLVGGLSAPFNFSGPPSRRAAHVSLKTHFPALQERFAEPATVNGVPLPGGVTEAGYRLSLEDRSARIATLVASNSGRPGGA